MNFTSCMRTVKFQYYIIMYQIIIYQLIFDFYILPKDQ